MAYEQLVEAFAEVAESANAGTVHSLPPRECFSFTNGHTTYLNYMYLKEWKWRPGKSKEKVSIVLKAEEVFNDDRFEVTKSTVCVSYYTENPWELLHSVHFDFDGPWPNHPIFHAQVTHEGVQVPIELTRQLKLDEVRDTTVLKCFKTARIPTSDMTLSSVLLCLVADHMPSDYVHEFLTKLQNLDSRLPQPHCEDIRSSLQSNGPHFRSRHWFAHMKKST